MSVPGASGASGAPEDLVCTREFVDFYTISNMLHKLLFALILTMEVLKNSLVDFVKGRKKAYVDTAVRILDTFVEDYKEKNESLDGPFDIHGDLSLEDTIELLYKRCFDFDAFYSDLSEYLLTLTSDTVTHGLYGVLAVELLRKCSVSLVRWHLKDEIKNLQEEQGVHNNMHLIQMKEKITACLVGITPSYSNTNQFKQCKFRRCKFDHGNMLSFVQERLEDPYLRERVNFVLERWTGRKLGINIRRCIIPLFPGKAKK